MSTLPEHDHCKNCGDPVPFDMAYCCEDCYWEYQRNQKKHKNREMLFWVSAVCVVVAGIVIKLVLG